MPLPKILDNASAVPVAVHDDEGRLLNRVEANDRLADVLLTVGADGMARHLPRAALASLFRRGDLVIANDAATLPASLKGVHCASGQPIEVRLAAWASVGDPTRLVAIAFGAGDHRTRTEDRSPPPPLIAGDRLALGPLEAVVEQALDPPCLFRLRFAAIARPSSPGSPGTGRRSNTRTSPSLWRCGTSGPELRPTRSHSNRPRPALRFIGARWRSGGGAASDLLR